MGHCPVGCCSQKRRRSWCGLVVDELHGTLAYALSRRQAVGRVLRVGCRRGRVAGRSHKAPCARACVGSTAPATVEAWSRADSCATPPAFDDGSRRRVGRVVASCEGPEEGEEGGPWEGANDAAHAWGIRSLQTGPCHPSRHTHRLWSVQVPCLQTAEHRAEHTRPPASTPTTRRGACLWSSGYVCVTATSPTD